MDEGNDKERKWRYARTTEEWGKMGDWSGRKVETRSVRKRKGMKREDRSARK